MSTHLLDESSPKVLIYPLGHCSTQERVELSAYILGELGQISTHLLVISKA